MYTRKNLLVNFSIIASLGVVTLLLNSGVLSGNWRWDDPAILLHLNKYSIVDDFVNPDVWQQFSPANLTPWLLVSFEIDLIIFGLRPVLFYVHQLVALTLAATALYFCLKLWICRKFSVYGAFLFLLGTPGLVVAQQLMTRHYVEGLVLSLLSLICFVLFLRQSRPVLLIASGLFYIVAITAKEIYVPLLVLLPFLPESRLRHRLKAMLPLVVIALAYTLWRGYMLNSLSGGYADPEEYLSAAYFIDMISSFSRFPDLMFGSLGFVFIFLYFLLVASYAIVCRSNLITSAAVALLCLIPLVPLVRIPGILSADRYLFLPWTALSFSMAYFADSIVQKFREQGKSGSISLVYSCAAIFMLISLSSSITIRQPVVDVGREYDVQAEYIWENNDQLAFVPSANILPAFWFVTDLVELKSRLLAQETSPLPVVDEIYLSESLPNLQEYVHDCRCLRDVVKSIPERLGDHQDRIRNDAGLSLSFEYRDGYFAWQFGPYKTGVYHAVSDVVGVIPVPTSGRQRVTLKENTPFYLRYTSPEGWITYSSQQRIRHNAPLISWQRE